MINLLDKEWFKVESSGNDETKAAPFQRYRPAIRTKSKIAKQTTRCFEGFTRNFILSCCVL